MTILCCAIDELLSNLFEVRCSSQDLHFLDGVIEYCSNRGRQTNRDQFPSHHQSVSQHILLQREWHYQNSNYSQRSVTTVNRLIIWPCMDVKEVGNLYPQHYHCPVIGYKIRFLLEFWFCYVWWWFMNIHEVPEGYVPLTAPAGFGPDCF